MQELSAVCTQYFTECMSFLESSEGMGATRSAYLEPDHQGIRFEKVRWQECGETEPRRDLHRAGLKSIRFSLFYSFRCMQCVSSGQRVNATKTV